MPFDWIFSDLGMNAHVIDDEFEMLIDPSKLISVEDAERSIKVGHSFYSGYFGRAIIFNHHDPRLSEDHARYKRYSDRFLKAARTQTCYFLAVVGAERFCLDSVEILENSLKHLSPGFFLEVIVNLEEQGGRSERHVQLLYRSASCAVTAFYPKTYMVQGMSFLDQEDNVSLFEIVTNSLNGVNGVQDMNNQSYLEGLATEHGSDKHGAHFYMKNYARHFSRFRTKKVNLLEIGIGGYEDPFKGGASLRVWRDYFPNGQICGLDVHNKHGLDEERIKTVQGSQSDPRSIARILQETGQATFDIIIDDGSHHNDDVVKTFMMLFPFVAQDGVYVVEDTQTSYWPHLGGSSNDLQSPHTMMSFFKALADGLNWQEFDRPGYAPRYTDLNITSIHFYHNMVFIEKGTNSEGSNIVVSNRLPL